MNNILIIFLQFTLLITKTAQADNYEILNLKNSPSPIWPEEMPKKYTTSIYRPGKTSDTLRGNAIRAYSYYWKVLSSYPVSGTREKALIKAIIASLPKRIKVENISDKLAIVEVPWNRADSLAEKTSIDEIALSGNVWLLENDTWVPFFGEYIPYQKIQRVDLNGDGYGDLVVQGGCCDTISINIFINKNNEALFYSQKISIIGHHDIKLTPNCSAEISVSHFQDDNTRRRVKFDCVKGRFQP